MPNLVCSFSECATQFYSKHSTAKYCTRRCAGIDSMRKPEVAERQRQRMRKYTDEDLLQALVEQAQELGRTPTLKEARYDGWTYSNRWGSYNAAVLAAGLIPNVVLPERYFENDRETVPLSLRFAILKRDGFTCQYCGGTPQQGYVLHVDHKVPRSKGGKAEPDNLVTACWLCNNGKSDTENTPG